jgi:Tfp pilus assembly protein PilN
MIQFNLLPDVKIQFIKAQRFRRFVMMISIATAAVAIAILIVLTFYVNVVQKKTVKNLTADITKYSNQIKNTKDLDKILTIQNQLKSLNTLHDQKPDTSKLFGYIAQITPASVFLNSLRVDLTGHTLTISGKTDSLSTINKFVDTLKFTTYNVVDKSDKSATDNATDVPQTKVFSSTVLSSFSKALTGSNFSINTNFDAVIFDSKQEIKFTVPNIITTRSETEKPAALFQQPDPVPTTKAK